MGRRGNPYDNAMAESLVKTLKVEGVYPMAFETFQDVAQQLPRFIEKYNAGACTRRSDTAAPTSSRRRTPGRRSKPPPDPCPPRGAHSIAWPTS